jgi:hypothetical protein
MSSFPNKDVMRDALNMMLDLSSTIETSMKNFKSINEQKQKKPSNDKVFEILDDMMIDAIKQQNIEKFKTSLELFGEIEISVYMKYLKYIFKYYNHDVFELYISHKSFDSSKYHLYFKYCKNEQLLRFLIDNDSEHLEDLLKQCYNSGYIEGLIILHENHQTHLFNVDYMVKNPYL